MMSWLPRVGQALIGLLFVSAGVQKLFGLAGTAAYIGSVGLPAPELLAILAAVIELVGGLMLVVGFRTFLSASALGVFVVLVSVLFHFDFSDQLQMTLLFKNVAILGGLLVIAGHSTASLVRPSAPLS